jgi:hypothetical protein
MRFLAGTASDASCTAVKLSMNPSYVADISTTPGPLFVVGVWRSGTSLLYSLLNQHSRIALLYEGDLPLLWPLFWLKPSENWLAKWNFWNQAVTRHRIDTAQPPGDFKDLRGACEGVYKHYANTKGASIWGEKSPTFHDRLPYLAKMFPTARFVIIWRSPMGICSSMARAARTSSWNARKGVRHRALMGCEEMQHGRKWLQTHGRQVHELSYDELTANPEASLRSLCDFLDISYEPQMALLADSDRSAIYQGEHHILVKSTSIAKAKDHSDALSLEFKQKIQRYMTMWQRKFSASWPPVLNSPVVDCREPSFIERTWDRSRYNALRSADLIVRMSLRVIPIGIWRCYRDFRERRYRAQKPSGNGA